MTKTNRLKRKAKPVSGTTTLNLKNELQFKGLAAAFLLVVLCAIAGSAQTEKVPIPMLTGVQHVGGYSPTATDHPEVVKSAEFAIATKNKKNGLQFELIEILTARTQSVAGVNYELCIEANAFKHAEDDELETKQFLVVVFSDLKGKLRLTSWLEKECSK